jgi:hypothetical protein
LFPVKSVPLVSPGHQPTSPDAGGVQSGVAAANRRQPKAINRKKTA